MTKKILQTLISIMSRPLNSKGAILCFHRILPEVVIMQHKGPNTIGLTYSVENFDSILNCLTTEYKVLSLDSFLSHMDSDARDFAVALTFDDGYKDNFTYALPVLEKYNCPATIYVTSGFIDKSACIWWFDLWNHIFETTSVNFEYAGRKYNFSTEIQNEKESCFFSIKLLFLSVPVKEHPALLKKITEQYMPVSHTALFLDEKELITLDAHPLITIGAHTVHHENLGILTEMEVVEEMKGANTFLSNLLGHPIKHFAYPYGNSGEAGPREYLLAAKTGYKSAVTLRTEIMGGNNKFALSRIPVLQTTGINEIKFAIDKHRLKFAYTKALLKYCFSFIMNQLRK